MSYEKLLRERRIQPHKAFKEDLRDLFQIIERDLKDASIKELSLDRRFATAYNAALEASKAVLYCEGYRTRGTGHHATAFQFVRIVFGKNQEDLVDYFDECRKKRNITDYDRAGQISEKEVDEIMREARNFFRIVKDWIKRNHPSLAP